VAADTCLAAGRPVTGLDTPRTRLAAYDRSRPAILRALLVAHAEALSDHRRREYQAALDELGGNEAAGRELAATTK
jgi:hypothetical protein